MAIAALLEFGPARDGGWPEIYDRVTLEINDSKPWERLSDFGGGMLAHVAGPMADGGWRVVDVWESRDDMDRFVGRLMPVLGPVLEEHGVPEPRIDVIPVHTLVTQ
jgi:hypothetical protein